MEVIFYTTHCPKCKILSKKLDEKHINYKVETDVEKMINLGIATVPVLQVNEEMLDFSAAVRWINGVK